MENMRWKDGNSSIKFTGWNNYLERELDDVDALLLELRNRKLP